jgi:ribose 5-phosphate isomerase A
MTETERDDLKRAAAARAVEYVASGAVIGLGSGSTVRHLLEILAARLASGALRDVVAVPTSEDTAERCRSLGIALTTLDNALRLALTIDGADEIGPRLNLIKGKGGAFLREKLVVLASRRFIVIADDSKRVRKLGTRAPVPVEVIPFGWSTHLPFFERLGSVPTLRRVEGGAPFVSDGGHYVVDCRFPRGIADPRHIARALGSRPGIVEHGLFLGLADRAVIAGAAGIRELTR